MAWQDTGLMMLRILIGDTSKTPDYGDQELEELLVVGAMYVKQEIQWTTTYVIDVPGVSITPDPTSTSADGEEFLNFSVLKAACLVDISTFRTKALSAGIEAKCGPVVLKTLEHISGFRELLTKGPCAAYKTLKKEYEFGNIAVCKAILSPFVNNTFDPSSLSVGRDNRSGFY
jgi:hypothetical protein